MLEELYLSENAIFDIERDSFRNMEALHTIDLSENCIFRMRPYIFIRNYHLIDIYLNYNYLDELPTLMPSSQFIRNLNVTGNRLTNMSSILYYTNIQSLDLSENSLTSVNITGQMIDAVEQESAGSFISSSESDDDNNSNNDEGNMQHRRRRAPSSFQHPENSMNRRRVNSNIDDRLSNPLPDSVGMRYKRAAARMNIDFEYNSNIQYLMDIFRPGRISEEAVQSLIKISLNENVSENLKVMIDAAIDYYKNQNPYRFRHEISKRLNDNEEGNEKVSVASFVYFLRNSIRSQTRRTSRNVNERLHLQLSYQQLEQLYKYSRINQMEYFTCRNCSLHSIDFLLQFTKLKYVDVSNNMIKSVDCKQLVSLKQLEYLLASDNNIVSLNFTSMLKTWPKLYALNLNNNPELSCDLVRKMQNSVYYLYKVFKLQVNKCK
jgi:hypothetical protein